NAPVTITSPLAVKASGEKNDIQYGDEIQMVDTTSIGNGTPGLQTLVSLLTTAAKNNKPLTLQVQRKGVSNLIRVRLQPVPRCSFGLVVENNTQELNAYADGKDLHFTLPLMNLLSDDELAFVAGHELAHNILEHVSKTQNNAAVGGLGGTLIDLIANSQGVNTGGKFGNIGASMGVMKYSQDFEREADYVGMYITELAGLPPEAAIGVIEKFSKQNPESIRYASTHPANAERAANARLTLAEIRQKQATGQPLQPNMRPPE
nr:M48 family metalloprotease [Alphaproteobacteria bacterium]